MATTIIDFQLGEAMVTLQIIRELSKHREPPILVLGSLVEDRPSINVTLHTAIGDADTAEVSREYKTGRSVTIQGKRDHRTEHFAFEWIAPRHCSSDHE